MTIEIIQKFIPKTQTRNRPGGKMEPKGIVIHETGNTSKGADALAHARYLLNGAGNRVVGWHITVDDKRVVQHLPYNEHGWHAGDGGKGWANLNTIGIEMCVNSDGDFAKTQKNTAALVASLIRRFGLSVTNLHQHNEFSQTSCPVNTDWIAFFDMVKAALRESSDNIELMSGWNGQVLKRGSKGTAVSVLQVSLIQLGYGYIMEQYGADGSFGSLTEKAVRAFQKDQKILVDGIAGPQTYEAVEAALLVDLNDHHSDHEQLYRVQVGAFANKATAERLADELKRKGYDTYIT